MRSARPRTRGRPAGRLGVAPRCPWEATFRGRSTRAAVACDRPARRCREVVRPSAATDLVEGGVQPIGREGARRRVRVAHAYRSVAAEVTKSSSSATVIRIAARARFRQDLAVPTGMPSAAAVSGNERSVVQDDDRPLGRVDGCEHAFDVHRIGTRDAVRDRRVMERRELDLEDPPTSTASQVETRIDGQSMEPGIELSGSRSPRRFFHAWSVASWTASRASSGSRRISRAAVSSRARCAPRARQRPHDRPGLPARRDLSGPRCPSVLARRMPFLP